MSTEHIPTTTAGQSSAFRPTTMAPPIELNNGDRMTRQEFHRLYEQMPEDFRAELIGGIVYVASPVKRAHGKSHLLFGALLAAYEAKTQGIDCGDNTTVLLGDEGEPQPDLYVRILPEYGGQSKTKNDYLEGGPELVIEIAVTSRAIDLHDKKNDYARYGVREYVVACVREQQLRWFDLGADLELQPDEAGIYRLQTFPGLWVNGPALFAQDYAKLIETLEAGLAMPEHAAFVKELGERHAKSGK